jgi:hypothetical protein
MSSFIFSPIGATVNIAATTSTGSVALTSFDSLHETQVRIANAGTVPVFIAFGTSTVTTTAAAGMPIMPGTAEVISVNPRHTHVAAITGSSTATVYFTTGSGA